MEWLVHHYHLNYAPALAAFLAKQGASVFDKSTPAQPLRNRLEKFDLGKRIMMERVLMEAEGWERGAPAVITQMYIDGDNDGEPVSDNDGDSDGEPVSGNDDRNEEAYIDPVQRSEASLGFADETWLKALAPGFVVPDKPNKRSLGSVAAWVCLGVFEGKPGIILQDLRLLGTDGKYLWDERKGYRIAPIPSNSNWIDILDAIKAQVYKDESYVNVSTGGMFLQKNIGRILEFKKAYDVEKGKGRKLVGEKFI